MKKHLYFLLIKKRNIILLKLNMLFILIVITLLLVQDMILKFMINLKTSNSSHCNFPYSYSGGEINEFNGGNSNFTVIECEAYHVEFE